MDFNFRRGGDSQALIHLQPIAWATSSSENNRNNESHF